MSIESIQKPVGQLKVLVYLHRNGRATAREITKGAGLNPATLNVALSHLKGIKLVRGLKNGGYKLTGKGEEVAVQLERVEVLLGE
jgi:Mn-dependent DtxR family transcriptional regulator